VSPPWHFVYRRFGSSRDFVSLGAAKSRVYSRLWKAGCLLLILPVMQFKAASYFGPKEGLGNIVLDLAETKLVDREVVAFLAGREADGMKFEKCPEYVRKWTAKEKRG
jgi:hypothetical protein